jgi:hypothetical protein
MILIDKYFLNSWILLYASNDYDNFCWAFYKNIDNVRIIHIMGFTFGIGYFRL